MTTQKKLIIASLFAMTVLSKVSSKDFSESSQKDFKWNAVPQAGCNILNLENGNALFTPSASLQLLRIKNNDSISDKPELITFKTSYAEDIFKSEIENLNEKVFYHVGFFGKIVSGKNSFLLKTENNAAKPFASFKYFEGLLMYGREITKTDCLTFVLGGGLAATDLGLKIGNIDIFMVPLPMFHFSYKNDFIDSFAEWIGLPSGQLVIMPENRIRLKLESALVGFDLPTDIKFDLSFQYFPLRQGFFKDYLFISGGIASNIDKFRCNETTMMKNQYYCAYGEINATAVSLSAGYTFGGKLNSSLFLSVQGMYIF